MRLAKCPQCDRVIDLDEIEELSVIGCGGKEGDLLPCEGCPLENNPIGCDVLRTQNGLTKTTIADMQEVK